MAPKALVWSLEWHVIVIFPEKPVVGWWIVCRARVWFVNHLFYLGRVWRVRLKAVLFLGSMDWDRGILGNNENAGAFGEIMENSKVFWILVVDFVLYLYFSLFVTKLVFGEASSSHQVIRSLPLAFKVVICRLQLITLGQQRLNSSIHSWWIKESKLT